MNFSKRLTKLQQKLDKVNERIFSLQLTIMQAHPVDWRKGMLAISHQEHFAYIAQLIASDGTLTGLRR